MIMKDGKEYTLRSYKELNDKTALIELDEEIVIPLLEAKEIKYFGFNNTYTCLVLTGLTGFIIILAALPSYPPGS